MTEINYKSLFVLHAYFYCFWEPKPDYNIDKEELAQGLPVFPGFYVDEMETGFYQSLAEAEKRIRQLAKNKKYKVHSFVVEEKPMDFPLGCNARLSCRRYLGNGKMWQTSEVSNVYYKGQKRNPLGDIVFHGCDPKTILFEEGDFVECAWENFVELAIVQKQPATVEQVNTYHEQRRMQKKYGMPIQCLGNLSDRYTLVSYSESKEGEIDYVSFDAPVVNVLPTTMPVPKKVAAELRRQLKAAQMSDENDLPF